VRGAPCLALALAAVACSSPTDSSPTSIVMVGQWTYSATQTSPVAATLSGVLTVSQQTGRTFAGSLDATQQDALGNVTHLSGVVSGQVVDTTGIEFSVQIGLDGRQHLGSLARDTVRGAWVDQGSGGVMSSGSFTAASRTGT